MTFFCLGTESIITGVLIPSLARCTAYLGFLFPRSQAVRDLLCSSLQSHFHELVPLLLCVSLRSVWTMRGPVLWQCKGEKYLPVWCQRLNTRANSLREALNSLSTNNSRNEEHLFSLLLLILRAARCSYLNSPFCRGIGRSIHSAGHLRTGFWSGLNEQLWRSWVRCGSSYSCLKCY